ncbi:MAG: beta-propeller domain-containing protein, partial [Propionibacteriaceae bacterium]|nr:beta-propeller domain-containing protein [Propionibacteriaceae bacterium]
TQGAASHQVATIDVAGLTGADELLTGPVVDLMIDGTTLVVLTHGFTAQTVGWSRGSGTWANVSASGLKAAFYDISDPTRPRYVSQLEQSGTYAAARLSGGVLYLVSTYMLPSSGIAADQPITYVPSVVAGGARVPVPAGDIYVGPWSGQPTYSLVTAIDVAKRSLLGEQAVLGGSGTVYMSETNLYLASAQWPVYAADGMVEPFDITIPGYDGKYGSSVTDIVRISLDGGALTVAASGRVAGYLLNQFAMDEAAGYLRVATTWDQTGNGMWSGQSSGLWILDSSLALVGSIPELAENETVQSVRFDGTVGYVVTFRRTDPLFAVDLRDPAAPTVQSALKIPGFSQYLHPFGDGLLLGVGMDADANGKVTGMKVAMFDVSDPYNVREISTTLIDADSTEVANDHKAAFVDVDRGLIGFATQKWTNSDTPNDQGWYESSTSWDYRLLHWTGSGFEELTTVNLADGTSQVVATVMGDGTVRGVRVGEDFYLVTANSVGVYELGTYARVGTVTLG